VRVSRLIPILLAASSAPALSNAQASAVEGPSLSAMVTHFGECVVRKHHDEAKSYLLSTTDFVARDIQNNASLFDRKCYSDSFAGNSGVSFVIDMYRSSVANALVKADFAATDPGNLADRPPLVHPSVLSWADIAKLPDATKRVQLKASFARLSEEADLSRLGECLVRADPAGARLWLLTVPDAPEDVSRSKALIPAFELCSKQASVVHYFDRERARGPVAVNYYRLAYATPRQPSGAAS
jgi:hypothetical protein